MRLNGFTVVLLTPDYACGDVGYGQGVYVAYVTAQDDDEALCLARAEAYAAFKQEDGSPGINDPLDFALAITFNGHPSIARFGWQL